MSDDETRPIEPDAPVPPPAPEPQQPSPYASAPYAMSVPAGYPAGYPTGYPAGHPAGYPAGYPAGAGAQRPRFADQVMGMRAVVAVALACLIIGGLSGFILGRASAHDNQERFVRPGFGTFQRGGFPNGPNNP